ncbi:MAG: hypothetical protein LC687_06145, partial [Actinobacteria bacterium]|nr:hypothetical protein [Actinomycetota bacterium]
DGQTGEWLIDPQDYTVAPEGGDITGSALSGNLTNNNVTIESVDGAEEGNGDIFVNDEVSWQSGNILTLDAQRDIEINAPVTATGDNAGLELNFSGSDYYVNSPVTLSGTNASLSINSNAYTLIQSMEELGNIDTTTGGNHRYALAKELDASGNIYDDALVATFTGTFTGLGHVIRNLSINATNRGSGLFGHIDNGSVVRDIGLVGGSLVSTEQDVGALAGLNNGQVNNAYASVTVKGTTNVGGLIGLNNGTVQNSHTTGNVEGSISRTGGLVGNNNAGSVSNAYAMGDVTGGSSVGGLVGDNDSGKSITNAYATGDVSGSENNIGGLVGTNEGQILSAYSTGTVVGTFQSLGVGGLVGANNFDGTTDNSFYATTDANGDAIDGDYTNTIGSGNTFAEMQDATTFTDAVWSGDVWSFPRGRGEAVEGYEVDGGLPYLTGVTREEDIDSETLFDGGWGGLTDGAADGSPYTITDWNQLQNINEVVDGGYDFELANNLDNNSTGYLEQVDDGSALANDGDGWVPIGDYTTPFNGEFDGLGHTISDLIINRSGSNNIGLFGYTDSATIRNIGLEGGSVKGRDYVGGLVGRSNYSSKVKNSYATGSAAGSNWVGGLVGFNDDSTVRNSFASGDVTGNSDVGGLVGYNALSIVSNSYATGSVTGNSDVGGLVGHNYLSTVSDSFWDTKTTGQSDGIGHDDSNQSDNVHGLTTAEMQDPFTFIDTGWDFADVWGKSRNDNNDGYMVLKVLDNTAYDYYVSLDDTNTSKTYGASDRALNSISLDGPGSADLDLRFNSTKDVGTYTYDASGVLDPQFNNGTEEDYYVEYGSGELTIDPRAITVAADDQQKTEGRTDPGFTWKIAEGNLVADDALQGDLARGIGEQPGTYTIEQGELTESTNPNYAIDFLEGELEITESLIAGPEDRPNTDSVINNVLATTANLQPQPTFSNSQLPVQVVGTGIRV